MSAARVDVRLEYADRTAAVYRCAADCATRDEAEIFGRLVAMRDGAGVWRNGRGQGLSRAAVERFERVPLAPVFAPTSAPPEEAVPLDIPLGVWMSLPVDLRAHLRALGFVRTVGCFRGTVRTAVTSSPLSKTA